MLTRKDSADMPRRHESRPADQSGWPRWTRATIIDALTAAYRETGCYWTVPAWKAAHRRPDVRIILQHFGHWRRAWEEVPGAVPDNAYHFWDQARVIDALREYYIHTQRRPTMYHWRHLAVRPNIATIIRYCGSWTEAWDAVVQSLRSDARDPEVGHPG